MKSVYIVTKGSYSDYHIVAVFETKEEAEAFTNGGHATDDADIDIEEWKVGIPSDEHPFRPVHQVHIELKTGDLVTVGWHGPRTFYDRQPVDYSFVAIYKGYSSLPDSITACSAVSQEHALKIAAEHRQAWLRETKGNEPLA